MYTCMCYLLHEYMYLSMSGIHGIRAHIYVYVHAYVWQGGVDSEGFGGWKGDVKHTRLSPCWVLAWLNSQGFLMPDFVNAWTMFLRVSMPLNFKLCKASLPVASAEQFFDGDRSMLKLKPASRC